MKTNAFRARLATFGACLLIGGCAAYDPGPPTEIIVDEATVGLTDDEVATVYWDHGVYRIDDLREQPTARDNMFRFRFARLTPGEHHFFVFTYHYKANYEYNWVYGDLAAGHRYKVERGESFGFLGGRTVWLLRNLTTGDVVAESVDCHNYCALLDILRTMHLQDTAAAPIPLEGIIEFRLPTGFGDKYFGRDEDRQESFKALTTRVLAALEESGLPIALEPYESPELILSISDLALIYESFGGPAEFAAYGLSGDYQIVISGEAVLSTSNGTEIDRWRVTAVGESPYTSFFRSDPEISLRTTEKAADRFSDRLVYDLRRRFLEFPQQSVLSHQVAPL